jgi:hypothetical protein
MKRAETEEHDMDKSMQNTLVFAKCLVEDGNHCGITSDVYHNELEKLARANRRDGESLQQSYVRMAEQTEKGALLLKAAIAAPKPKAAPQDLVPRSKPKPAGPASRELDEMAREMARAKKISFEQAHTALQTDPTRAELVARMRREEREATNRVASARWPIDVAEEEFEQNWRLGRSPGSARM